MGGFDWYFRKDTVPAISDLFISFGGDSIRVTKPDSSLLLYHLNSRGFSIQYSGSNEPDIDAIYGGVYQFGMVPIDLIFKEEKNSVYLLFVISASNTAFDPLMPLRILKQDHSN
jgi:hypothetical protein